MTMKAGHGRMYSFHDANEMAISSATDNVMERWLWLWLMAVDVDVDGCDGCNAMGVCHKSQV